jgi:hypothetical protein
MRFALVLEQERVELDGPARNAFRASQSRLKGRFDAGAGKRVRAPGAGCDPFSTAGSKDRGNRRRRN